MVPSLHDIVPAASDGVAASRIQLAAPGHALDGAPGLQPAPGDRKSTRLNSSHQIISYAVFCLKKKTYHPSDGSPLAVYITSKRLTDLPVPHGPPPSVHSRARLPKHASIAATPSIQGCCSLRRT